MLEIDNVNKTSKKNKQRSTKSWPKCRNKMLNWKEKLDDKYKPSRKSENIGSMCSWLHLLGENTIVFGLQMETRSGWCNKAWTRSNAWSHEWTTRRAIERLKDIKTRDERSCLCSWTSWESQTWTQMMTNINWTWNLEWEMEWCCKYRTLT